MNLPVHQLASPIHVIDIWLQHTNNRYVALLERNVNNNFTILLQRETKLETTAYNRSNVSLSLYKYPVTLKMHDLKMTDKENYGSGKCKSEKWRTKTTGSGKCRSTSLVEFNLHIHVLIFQPCIFRSCIFSRPPCGHSRFCAQCADAVAVMPNGYPLCRTPIDMVMRVYFWCVSGELS